MGVDLREEKPKLNLYRKLVKIRESVPYLSKSTKGYQYKYVSSEQALSAIRDTMNDHGVVFIPEVRVSRVKEFNDAKGKLQFLTELDMKYTVVDADNPQDSFVVNWYAQGVDNAEKGVGKALTYGEKYLILKLFNIPTGNMDPDKFQGKDDDDDDIF
jgi:hypothetical protein